MIFYEWLLCLVIFVKTYRILVWHCCVVHVVPPLGVRAYRATPRVADAGAPRCSFAAQRTRARVTLDSGATCRTPNP